MVVSKRKDVESIVERNQDIKSRAKQGGIPLWRVAEELGYSDTGFYKLLRRELPQKKKEEIIRIIDRLGVAKETIGA